MIIECKEKEAYKLLHIYNEHVFHFKNIFIKQLYDAKIQPYLVKSSTFYDLNNSLYIPFGFNLRRANSSSLYPLWLYLLSVFTFSLVNPWKITKHIYSIDPFCDFLSFAFIRNKKLYRIEISQNQIGLCDNVKEFVGLYVNLIDKKLNKVLGD